jgi:hypothetical protein
LFTHKQIIQFKELTSLTGRSGLYEYAVDSAWRIGSTKGFFGSVITVVPSYNNGFSLIFPTISSDLIRFDELVTTKVCYKKITIKDKYVQYVS